MKKGHILLIYSFLYFLSGSHFALAQKDPALNILKDNTPIEYLDYDLTKSEFFQYYGIDDTARAIINLFIRKRGPTVVHYCIVPMVAGGAATYLLSGRAIGGLSIFEVINGYGPLNSLLISGLVVFFGGVLAYPIIAALNRSIYSRQKLLYTLVGRERGQRIPHDILNQLQERDFQ